jgi:hypothetical protein
MTKTGFIEIVQVLFERRLLAPGSTLTRWQNTTTLLVDLRD